VCQREIWLLGTRHLACEIGSVCTDPGYRGQGLATRLLEESRREAVSDGADIFLISGGRGLYRRLGYVDVGGYRVCTVKRRRLPEAGPCSLEPWAEEDLPTLVRIHSREPVRFSRPPEDFRTLLRAGRVMNGEAETRLVTPKKGDPVAYVSYRVPGAEGVAEDELSIDEVAGSRWDIAGTLPLLFDEYDVGKVLINFLESDAEMNALVRTFGWPWEQRGFHGTVGIIEPVRFWRACAPLFRERLGTERFERLGFASDGKVTITCGGEDLTLDGMRDLTELAFIPRSRRKGPPGGLPAESELARALDSLFPLPLVDYGMNFI
jgi:hypothetical protein